MRRFGEPRTQHDHPDEVNGLAEAAWDEVEAARVRVFEGHTVNLDHEGLPPGRTGGSTGAGRLPAITHLGNWRRWCNRNHEHGQCAIRQIGRQIAQALSKPRDPVNARKDLKVV